MATTESTASTEEIARAYFDATARQDIDTVIGLWEPGGTGSIVGMVDLQVPDGYREWFTNLFRGFPEFQFEVLDLIAAGEKAAVHWRARGTFDGDVSFEGLDPNGATVDVYGCDV